MTAARKPAPSVLAVYTGLSASGQLHRLTLLSDDTVRIERKARVVQQVSRYDYYFDASRISTSRVDAMLRPLFSASTFSASKAV